MDLLAWPLGRLLGLRGRVARLAAAGRRHASDRFGRRGVEGVCLLCDVLFAPGLLHAVGRPDARLARGRGGADPCGVDAAGGRRRAVLLRPWAEPLSSLDRSRDPAFVVVEAGRHPHASGARHDEGNPQVRMDARGDLRLHFDLLLGDPHLEPWRLQRKALDQYAVGAVEPATGSLDGNSRRIRFDPVARHLFAADPVLPIVRSALSLGPGKLAVGRYSGAQRGAAGTARQVGEASRRGGDRLSVRSGPLPGLLCGPRISVRRAPASAAGAGPGSGGGRACRAFAGC